MNCELLTIGTVCKVGSEVGTLVKVGTLVVVGTKEGDCVVGSSVGVCIGCEVGSSVGAKEGSSVGAVVGSSVGSLYLCEPYSIQSVKICDDNFW